MAIDEEVSFTNTNYGFKYEEESVFFEQNMDYLSHNCFSPKNMKDEMFGKKRTDNSIFHWN